MGETSPMRVESGTTMRDADPEPGAPGRQLPERPAAQALFPHKHHASLPDEKHDQLSRQ
jgi:hypothetical protein